MISDLFAFNPFFQGFNVYILRVPVIINNMIIADIALFVVVASSLFIGYYLSNTVLRKFFVIAYVSMGLFFFYRFVYAVYAYFAHEDPNLEHYSLFYDIRVQIIVHLLFICYAIYCLREMLTHKPEK